MTTAPSYFLDARLLDGLFSFPAAPRERNEERDRGFAPPPRCRFRRGRLPRATARFAFREPPFGDSTRAPASRSDRSAAAISARGARTSKASSASARVLPCASRRNDTVPPPPSDSCNRKLSAHRFGTSKRSTLPSAMPWKRFFTRVAVRVRRSHGQISGARAITPMFAVSPLSPLRAWASFASGTVTRRREPFADG